MPRSSDTFMVAAVQDVPVFLDGDKTIEKACGLIADAGRGGARLVVFPEAFVSGYPDRVWLVPNSHGAVIKELYAELINTESDDMIRPIEDE